MRDPDPGARTFSLERRAGFADCAPSGRVRLDALARWIQDVAYADIADAGLDRVAVWVLRRARIHVSRFPRFGERFRLTTFCSGAGRMWAERRTDMVDARGERQGPDVQAVGLWVHLDPRHGRPFPLLDAELATYSGVRPLRRVTARLRHQVPDRLDGGAPWRFRATDCDVAGHVNNAAYWQPLEEELLACDEEPDRIDAEIEFRSPAQPGRKRVIVAGAKRWIVDEHGEPHASIELLDAPRHEPECAGAIAVDRGR